MAESKEVDALLDELIHGTRAEEILGKYGLVKELTKRLVERALEGEMTSHVGDEKPCVLLVFCESLLRI